MKNILEELKTKFAQLNSRERIVVMLGVSAAMIFLFTRYSFMSNLRAISELRTEIEMKSQDVDIAKAEGAGLEELQQEYKRLTEQITDFEAKIPQETRLDRFMNDLTKMASNHAVAIKSIKSANVDTMDSSNVGAIMDGNKKEEYNKLTIELNLLSQPEKLLEFLDDLAAMSRLVSVKEFEISAQEEFLPEVSVRLVVATYSIE